MLVSNWNWTSSTSLSVGDQNCSFLGITTLCHWHSSFTPIGITKQTYWCSFNCIWTIFQKIQSPGSSNGTSSPSSIPFGCQTVICQQHFCNLDFFLVSHFVILGNEVSSPLGYVHHGHFCFTYLRSDLFDSCFSIRYTFPVWSVSGNVGSVRQFLPI